MANQDNFQSNIEQLSQEYKKFSVSRIFSTMENPLLEMEIPVEMPVDNAKSNVEINLYSVTDNSLIYTDVIKAEDDAIVVETYQYNEPLTSVTAVRKLLFIDFSKFTNTFIPPGEYLVTLNFFYDELGSNENKLLKLNNISPSRQEIQFSFTEDYTDAVNDFLSMRMPANMVLGYLAQICNQPNSRTLNIPVINNTTDSTEIKSQLPITIQRSIELYGFDKDVKSNIGIYNIAQNLLDDAYNSVRLTIQNQISAGVTVFYSNDVLNLVYTRLSFKYEEEQDKGNRFLLV